MFQAFAHVRSSSEGVAIFVLATKSVIKDNAALGGVSGRATVCTCFELNEARVSTADTATLEGNNATGVCKAGTATVDGSDTTDVGTAVTAAVD